MWLYPQIPTHRLTKPPPSCSRLTSSSPAILFNHSLPAVRLIHPSHSCFSHLILTLVLYPLDPCRFTYSTNSPAAWLIPSLTLSLQPLNTNPRALAAQLIRTLVIYSTNTFPSRSITPPAAWLSHLSCFRSSRLIWINTNACFSLTIVSP